MSGEDLYLKRGTEILGPYTWNELNELAQAGKLSARELVGDSAEGEFQYKSMQRDLFLDYVESSSEKLISPPVAIRVVGSLFLFSVLAVTLTAGVKWSAIKYPSAEEREQRAGVSADNRLAYTLERGFWGILFWATVPALPGAFFFSRGRRYYMALSGTILALLPGLYLTLISMLFSASEVLLWTSVCFVLNVVLMVFLIRNRACFS
ncbi:MAG: hypothetical protein KDA65_08195 [Planctomycetaceae bacterium]|nr:hypothetical protein [Planctomycetaceae bacterium]